MLRTGSLDCQSLYVTAERQLFGFYKAHGPVLICAG